MRWIPRTILQAMVAIVNVSYMQEAVQSPSKSNLMSPHPWEMACYAFQTCTRKAHLQLDKNAAPARLAASSEVPVAVVAPVEAQLLIAHCVLLLRPPVYAEASPVNCCSISLVTHRDSGSQVIEERGMCMDPNRKLLTPCQTQNWRQTEGVTGAYRMVSARSCWRCLAAALARDSSISMSMCSASGFAGSSGD